MTEDLLQTIVQLRESFGRDTSQLQNEWTADNPSTGQCAVVSIILQALYGGDIARGVTSGGVVHYWNVIDGVTVDATRDQFDATETFSSIEINPPAERYLFRETAEKVVLLLTRAFAR